MKVGTDSMLLGAFLDVNNKKRVLDIGTGTGVLSLMCAQKNPDIEIDAIELEFLASEEAKTNFSNSIFNKQINLIFGDFLTYTFNNQYDLIFSNPPYFENSLKTENNNKNLARHNDSLPFDLLFEKVKEILGNDGLFYIILPASLENNIINLAEKHKLFLVRKHKIYSKPSILNRIIFVFSKIRVDKILIEELIIRNENASYTDDYIKLTKDFHYKNLN
jgi:tRNA1Val (adenine37-N6)-methyltransferase